MNSTNLYDFHDLITLQAAPQPQVPFVYSLHSIDELLERDNRREKDGFPRKIRIGKLVRPGSKEKGKIILVPTTVEEKFVHDTRQSQDEQDSATGGSGDGEEGQVIGEEPIHGSDCPGAGEAGEGDGGEHEIESSAYDLGRILAEKFQLPNLQDKGKKRFISQYTYDLTDKHVGVGQILDKKATLRNIIETNFSLGNAREEQVIDPSQLIVSPADKIYRILSKEKEYESQALIFFVRDYSGSMTGKPTETVVAQHVLIYSWLLYQYDKQVETRYVLHDTEAKEVDDFYTYYNSSVAGGTHVVSAYKLVNDIVEAENLARDYNIYVFHGTDGDDWDKDGKQTLPELEKMLTYTNRVGITVANGFGTGKRTSPLETYINDSGLLDEHPDLLRMDSIGGDESEERLIEGIKRMTS